MQTVQQLIYQFKPDSYKLSLNFDRKGREFNGSITINGTAQPKNNNIILHSKDLVIESIILNGKNAKFSYSKNDELIISHPDIKTGKYILFITYSGKITDSMHGLYPCYYKHKNIKKELLATQFESHHAREVFPCIDEPAAKATFDVTLKTETEVTVLGNMPIKSQSIADDKLVTTFETTPVMSSYLLAWVIGELHKKTAHTQSGVEVNVWATPAQPSDNLDFALDIAVRTIDFFDKYFGTPYPLSKCDHVALPDFASGAMENWGLITYREVALLADPKTSSISSKRYAATVISHELSHQWFGNLVTMKWWNDLWLNESFASLVEYTAIDALEPSWNVWLDFASFESISALRRDSLDGVQPVQTEVNHPDEISTLFDGAIVYAKGARLLQMLQNYIGEAVFQSGLKQYFKDFAYKNTESADLWGAFDKSSGKDITNLMKRWISQPGFPVLHVAQTDDKILLTQERLSNKPVKKADVLWPIALNSNNTDMPKMMDTPSLSVTIKNNPEPLRFNVGSTAHFVTHYPNDLMKQIIEQLKNGDLSPIDRLQLLNEQTILARAGIISSAELVPLINAYNNETSEIVWDIISLTIGELKKFVEDDEKIEKKLRTLAGKLAIKQYIRLGWEQRNDETEDDTKLRATILSLMIYSEDQNVINKAIEIFKTESIDNIDPELRSLILSTVVRYNDDKEIIDKLLEIYKITDSSELRQDINTGLTSTRNSEIINLLLDKLKDTTLIRTQDTSRWIIYLMRNKYSRNQTWQWVRDNWSWIKETFGGDKNYDDYPQYTATVLNSRQQLNEYRDFFEPLINDPILTRAVKMGINEISNQIDVIERDSPKVRETLLNLFKKSRRSVAVH
jgi:aminopeptidase N